MRRHRIETRYVLPMFLAFQLMFFAVVSPVAHAGGTIKIDDTHSVSIGMGLRSSFNVIEGGSNKGGTSKDFLLDSFRFYLGGQLHEIITFEFNTDYDTAPAGTEDLRVLDGVVKVALHDLFQVWVGRFLPPSDRSNLSGPYFLNAWDFPFFQKYPNVFAGRDDGLAVFGQVGGGMFKYQIGVFQGSGEASTTTITETNTKFTDSNDDTVTVPVTTTTTIKGPNQSDTRLYTGRLTLNLLDPEPGYYNSSTYYGGKDVLAIGLVAMGQSDAVGTATSPGDFFGWNVDFLYENKLGGAGVLTVEGAYYDYDGDGKALAPQSGKDGKEGNGYFALASFLLPNKIGSGPLQGQLQPMVRYQEFSNEGNATGDHTRLDLAVSHIINGHNARLTLTYSMDESAANVDTDRVKFGLQFQI